MHVTLLCSRSVSEKEDRPLSRLRPNSAMEERHSIHQTKVKLTRSVTCHGGTLTLTGLLSHNNNYYAMFASMAGYFASKTVLKVIGLDRKP